MTRNLAEQGAVSNGQRTSPVKVIHGDLLAQTDVDAVVSFLTDDLSWGGPINQKLIGMVGHQLDKHVLETVLKPTAGEAFSTSSYGLPYKYLLFGIIPPWDDGLSGEDRFLKYAMKNILQLAQKLGIKSLALPALGLMKVDLPLRRGARVIFKAIEEDAGAAFDEIRIVCKTPAALVAYRERLNGQ